MDNNWPRLMKLTLENGAQHTDRALGQMALTKIDTAGEVSFTGMSTLTNPVFRLVLKVNRAYFRLRHQYQK
jgi:hypothetical protein